MVSRGQQRGNPFSLMNHETRQRHRNTLKEECGGARSFVALPLPSIFPSFAPPLRSIFIFLSFFSTPDSFQLRILHFSPQLSFQFLRCSKKTTYLEISSPPIIENEISTRDAIERLLAEPRNDRPRHSVKFIVKKARESLRPRRDSSLIPG